MTRPLRKPTGRQLEIVRFVVMYQRGHGGTSPSGREFARAMGVEHASIERSIRRAIRHGLLKRTPRVVQVEGGIVVTPLGRDHPPVVKQDGVALGRRGRKGRK